MLSEARRFFLRTFSLRKKKLFDWYVHGGLTRKILVLEKRGAEC